MEEEKKEEVLRMLQGLDISEVMRLMMSGGNRYNRRILKFFKWFSKWVPIAIMLFHAYGIWDFSRHPREMFTLYQENMACYIFIYFMLYVLPMVIILASRFFWLCWRYRIPFFYFFGVNAIHLAYFSCFTTNEMVTSHFALMVMTVTFYLYGLVEMFCETKIGKKLFS